MPVNKVGEIWSDIDHRFSTDGLGNIKKVINVESVMTSIDNILRTSPNERVLLPEFGCSLGAMLFDNMNSALMNFMSREIRDSIERWDNRVVVSEVDFSSDPDSNSISVSIHFMIRGQGKIFEYKKPLRGDS
jgi:phage baseplate assembly protein W